jgi:arginyl-tRNA synthetase
MDDQPLPEKAKWLAARYVEGNTAFDDKTGAESINDINARVYRFHTDNDQTSELAKVYWLCRKWSYEYFDEFYASIGSKFEKYYPESETAGIGLKKAKELLAEGILKSSDGAVVFPGEEHGLHTRVFITSKGLPTYESKDLGLQIAKWNDYHFDKSVIITGNDIIEYMKVVLKVVSKFEPKLSDNTIHLTHGMVKLKGGVKMSSRMGNTLRAQDVIDVTEAANHKNTDKNNQETTLAAIKYAFLKQKVSGDIVYDPEESISIEGNSGPYLQYSHARARSIIDKAKTPNSANASSFDYEERKLAVKIVEYPEVVSHAVAESSPHYICTYLYELAQIFNRFYEKNRVIDNEREEQRIQLVVAYADVLKEGLGILNIAAPEHI